MEHKYEMTNQQAIEMLETFKKVFDTPETNYREALIGSIEKGITALRTMDMWNKITVTDKGIKGEEGLTVEAYEIINRVYYMGYENGYKAAREES